MSKGKEKEDTIRRMDKVGYDDKSRKNIRTRREFSC